MRHNISNLGKRLFSSYSNKMPPTFLSQEQAQSIDNILMSDAVGYKLEQLMELAGQSVAHICHHVYPPNIYKRVLIVSGPGNNGGDGLVAARHLSLFGYTPTVLYPKPGNNIFFSNLVKLLAQHEIEILSSLRGNIDGEFDIIIDAILGFSYSGGTVREPFNSIINTINLSNVPKLSVDIPSGWDVEKGNMGSCGVNADCLVSLTAPKLGTKDWSGSGGHYLSGRGFIPPLIQKQFNIQLPIYNGASLFTLI
eukprot:GHVR01013210.1.p1 GENE.GHVR01013210.1~~GHVR01013210.1.p1  ORF type:complete len:252 (+),score=56.51 GHVR01013210.1:2-757(+)